MRARTPLGYHRHRDPRHYRFPVPNEVWQYKLRPTEFVILSYLCYQRTHDRGETASAKAVADALRLSVVTVEKHLATLKGKVVPRGERAPGKFFSLPNEVFLLALPPSAFVVYACLLTCEDRRTHRCHPSYRTMAKMTGLSLNTVMKAVGVLIDKKLIAAEYTHWFNKQGLSARATTSTPSCPSSSPWVSSISGSWSAAALRWVKKVQDKGVPPQAAPLQPLLPTVRAVSGGQE